MESKVEIGHFYFIDNNYFNIIKNGNMSLNKESSNRPYLCVGEDENTGVYWMVPFSSKLEKYWSCYDKKMERFGRCDTIAFADVLGKEKAFLIQNICPVTTDFVKNKYVWGAWNSPVRLNENDESNIISKALYVIDKCKNGVPLAFTPVNEILKLLTNNTNKKRHQPNVLNKEAVQKLSKASFQYKRSL